MFSAIKYTNENTTEIVKVLAAQKDFKTDKTIFLIWDIKRDKWKWVDAREYKYYFE